MLMVGMVLKASGAALWRWLRLLAVVVGAVVLTAVGIVVQACGGRAHTESPEDAGRDAGRDAGTDAGRDAGPDAGPDAGLDAGRDAEVIRDADLPDVPLE